MQKRAQRDDKEAASCREYEICREGTEAQRRGSLEAACRRVTPRGFCMDVKRKGLREKGFVKWVDCGCSKSAENSQRLWYLSVKGSHKFFKVSLYRRDLFCF